MARIRVRIQPEDLLNGSLVRSSKTGFVYQLGEPKKRNVNKNVVNHCQLLNKKTGAVVGTGWYNMTNLRDMGFKYYGPAPKNRPAPDVQATGEEVAQPETFESEARQWENGGQYGG